MSEEIWEGGLYDETEDDWFLVLWELEDRGGIWEYCEYVLFLMMFLRGEGCIGICY